MNPAAVPTPLEDIQGDGRWLSMVRTRRRIDIALVIATDAVTAATGVNGGIRLMVVLY